MLNALRRVRSEAVARRRHREGRLNHRDCRLVSIDPNDLDADWEVAGRAESLFHRMGIRIASYEETFEACMTPGGEVAGASVVGYTDGNDFGDGYRTGELRFSIVVDEGYQRRGIARSMVRSVVDHWRSQQADLAAAHGVQDVELVAWVVNPYMAALLDSEGFDTDGSKWSPDEPHMRLR